MSLTSTLPTIKQLQDLQYIPPIIYVTPTDVMNGLVLSSGTYVLTGDATTSLKSVFTVDASSAIFDGNGHTITIVNQPDFEGLFTNGLRVENLTVAASGNSALIHSEYMGAGWFFAEFTTYASAYNCDSSGPIAMNAGGIFGSSCSYCVAAQCSSTGNLDDNGGGIFGRYVFNSSAINSWSSGTIGMSAGGIFAEFAGGTTSGLNTGYSATAIGCYSTGSIGNLGGGIFGAYAGINNGKGLAQDCYSLGTTGTNAGSIFGAYAGLMPGTATAINCYGLYGPIFGFQHYACTAAINCYSPNSPTNAAAISVYSGGGTTGWTDASANLYLTSVFTTTWFNDVSNTPYRSHAQDKLLPTFAMECMDISSGGTAHLTYHTVVPETFDLRLLVSTTNGASIVFSGDGVLSDQYTLNALTAGTYTVHCATTRNNKYGAGSLTLIIHIFTEPYFNVSNCMVVKNYGIGELHVTVHPHEEFDLNTYIHGVGALHFTAPSNSVFTLVGSTVTPLMEGIQAIQVTSEQTDTYSVGMITVLLEISIHDEHRHRIGKHHGKHHGDHHGNHHGKHRHK